MEYNRETMEEIFEDIGEIMLVLESDREYELHPRNVTLEEDHIFGEGTKEYADGATEWLEVWIPYGAIEHHYTHKSL